jgi:hypothetical protein
MRAGPRCSPSSRAKSPWRPSSVCPTRDESRACAWRSRTPGRVHAQGQYRARHQEGVGGDGENYEEVRYEGYGPGGVAVIVEALTDNRNRTASNVRSTFTKNGGALGETGSVSFMFDRVGEITYPAKAGAPTR